MSKLCIISCDKVFARMLELELNGIGLEPKLICEKLKAPALNLAIGNAEWVIFDGEYYSGDLSFIESNNSTFIVFDKEKRSNLPTNVFAAFERPFAISEFIESAASMCGTPSAVTRSENAIALELDAFSKQVSVMGKVIKFSAKEFALLSLLCKNRGRIVSRKEVIETVWGKDYNLENNVDNVYINYLRKKLDNPLGIKLICTIRGKGYMMK